MPVREIKTTLKIDGETKFKQALADAGREMQVLNSDLRAAKAEFAATGDEQRYLVQKSELLTSEVRQQEQIVEALGRAMREARDAYGDTARETDNYRIKLSNATAKMYDLRKASEEADRELKSFGRDSVRIGQQIENGIGDAAKEASDDLEDMFDKVSSDLGALKASIGVQTAIEIGGAVIDAWNAVSDFVADNNDLNRKKTQLIHNAEGYGISAEEIMELVSVIAGATGEMDSAMEAASNLAAAGFKDQEQRLATVRAMLGVYIASGSTLGISEIAESFLESINEGQATGTYAEALTKFAGMTSEQVEGALSSAKTINERIELATAYLTEAGMQTKWTTYEASYSELLDYQHKQNELTLAWSELAEELTPLVTGITSGITVVVNHMTAFVDGFKTGVEKRNQFLADAGEWLKTAVDDVAGMLSDPEGYLTDFATKVETQWNQWKEAGQAAIDWVKGALDTAFGWVDDLVDFFSHKESDPVYLETFGEGLDALKAELGSFEDTRNRTAAENQAIFDKYDANDLGVQKLYQEIDAIYRMLGMEFGVTLKETAAEDGKEAGNSLVEGMAESEENAKTAGKNFMIAVENGVIERAPHLYATLGTIMANAASILNQPVGVAGSSVYAGSGGGNPNQTAAAKSMAVLEIDGRTAGRLLYSGVSAEGARRTRTTMTIG